MSTTIAERRQIENEVIFRRSNEKITDGLDAIDAMNIEDNRPEHLTDEELILHFLCECSDENCQERIPLKKSRYQEIHADRKKFILMPNHQVDTIEKVILEKPAYSVVKKDKLVSKPGKKLNKTSIDNSSI